MQTIHQEPILLTDPNMDHMYNRLHDQIDRHGTSIAPYVQVFCDFRFRLCPLDLAMTKTENPEHGDKNKQKDTSDKK